MSGRWIYGTAGWSYKDWVGPFYPEGTPSERWLELYAQRYPGVEIDSTYYRTPSPSMVKGWDSATPAGFVFSPKMVGAVTHEAFLQNCDDEAQRHVEVLQGLGAKLGPVILQFPYYRKDEGVTLEVFLERLLPFVERLPRGVRYGVEVRNKPFLKPALLDGLRAREIALVLVDHVWMPAPPAYLAIPGIFTADFVPIRLIGDRHGIEKITKTWEKVVVDQRARVRAWAQVAERALREGYDVNAFANNHYAGHGPATANQMNEFVSGSAAADGTAHA